MIRPSLWVIPLLSLITGFQGSGEICQGSCRGLNEPPWVVGDAPSSTEANTLEKKWSIKKRGAWARERREEDGWEELLLRLG